MTNLSNLAKDIQMSNATEQEKSSILQAISRLNKTKINILITGATGCGKSSTINALFNTNVAKVGQGVDPETMDIQKYELNNIILWDSPGLGDGKEKDRQHAKNITDKLYEKDKDGNALIDLVLVILDGSSRDLGTSYELINNVIIPCLGDDDRLLVAINQCDMAMKGRHWNFDENKPDQTLINFLDEKVLSTKNRIKEATKKNVEVIYYSAGYKDGDEEQQPYNLSKLLMHIVHHTKPEKRAVYINDINQNKKVWENDDGVQNYIEETQKSMIESVISGAKTGSEIGAKIGSVFGSAGETVGSFVGGAIGAVGGLIRSIF